jgi:hypothetical protein
MDKRIAGLFGAAAALATLGGAHVASAHQLEAAMTANSYDDLLQPISDPLPLLQLSDATLRDDAADTAKVELVDHHHHHHHRPRHRHHHHHHHHDY